MAYNSQKSKTVMVVYFREGVGQGGRTFYSSVTKDKKLGWKATVEDMINRLLLKAWKGKFVRAVVYKNDYDNKQGEMLQYYLNDELKYNVL